MAGNYGVCVTEDDTDGDGVLDIDDLCIGEPQLTELNIPTFPEVKFGVNRNLVIEGTMSQNRKSGLVASPFSLGDTSGCSCKQILDACADAGTVYGEGHYKYGCSNSVLESWVTGSGNSGVPHPEDGYRCE